MNPYDPPAVDLDSEGARSDRGLVDAAILPRWERLRWVYNGVLTLVVVVMLGLTGVASRRSGVIVRRLVVDVLLANALYCVGPVAEWYVRSTFKSRSPAVTWILFAAVTGLASLLAAFAMMLWLLADLDW